MFTGIVERLGKIRSIKVEGGLFHYGIETDIADELKVDQSVAHDGVCLTVTKIEGNVHFVTAVQETLDKTNLSSWSEGRVVNIERCMPASGRFDGHIVQGHVDSTGVLESINQDGENIVLRFSFTESFKNLVVEKGSICINGTSLTVFEVENNSFSVTIIPYTWENTSVKAISEGGPINLEFDILGKYINKMLEGR